MNKPSRLLSIPPALLQILGKISGKQMAIARLLSSLQIDNRKICNTLQWQTAIYHARSIEKRFCKMSSYH